MGDESNRVHEVVRLGLDTKGRWWCRADLADGNWHTIERTRAVAEMMGVVCDAIDAANGHE